MFRTRSEFPQIEEEYMAFDDPWIEEFFEVMASERPSAISLCHVCVRALEDAPYRSDVMRFVETVTSSGRAVSAPARELYRELKAQE